jgi:predicted RNase H-like nuclease
MRVLGIDLAWATDKKSGLPNETGVVAVEQDGTVVTAGWTRGLDETVDWINAHAAHDTLAMIDAPLVVTNESGQRLCEKQTGQRYGRWKVSANSTNMRSPRLGGQELRLRLEDNGWTYNSGWDGPPEAGKHLSECYPYTALVGAVELGYEHERPVYKRKPKRMPAVEFRRLRAAACDDLIGRLDSLADVDPRLRLREHPMTGVLIEEPSPLADAAYKHREDLIDAAICAWTGLLWLRFGMSRCQVLGESEGVAPATIIAPARPEQRGSVPPVRSSL